MRQILLLSCLLIAFTFQVNAQGGFAAGQVSKSFGTGGVIKMNEITPKGSVYYSDDWLKGNVRSIDQVLIENLTFRYNIKDQSLVIKLDDDQVKIVKNRYINDFQFTDQDGKLHEFKRANTYKLKGRSMGGFVEVIHEGKFDLLYRYSSKYKPAENRPNYGSNDSSPAYIKQVDLLATSENNNLTAVKNKKELLSLFNDKAAEMKRYFKDNKVKLRDFDSLKETVKHYKGL